MEDTERDFESFKNSLEKGLCDICGKEVVYFNKQETCLHWLLKPEGVDKKDIVSVLSEFQFSRIQAYVRWIANCEAPFRNINDLVEEGKSKKLIEETIRYKNLENNLLVYGYMDEKKIGNVSEEDMKPTAATHHMRTFFSQYAGEKYRLIAYLANL